MKNICYQGIQNLKEIITIRLKKKFINPRDVCQSVIIDKALNYC